MMAEGGKESGSGSPFSDPVFKKISLKNGEINKLGYAELKKLARKLHISLEGSTDILKKRVKSHYRKMFLNEAEVAMPRKPYPYYIIIDYEATCEDREIIKTDKVEFQHEIIEFPAVLVNSETLSVESIFHEYVRPTFNKKLTEYCITLTGISQEQVDTADTFPVVLQKFDVWLREHNLIGRSAIVTDGPWDMARFLYMQVKISRLSYPKFAKRWVNIKKAFSNFYHQRKPKLDVMLKLLNFEFEGRHHSGIDDSINISKILIQLLKDGSSVQVNERIDLSTFNTRGFRPVYEIVKPVMVENGSYRKDDIITYGVVNDENHDGSSSDDAPDVRVVQPVTWNNCVHEQDEVSQAPNVAEIQLATGSQVMPNITLQNTYEDSENTHQERIVQRDMLPINIEECRRALGSLRTSS